MIRAHVCFSIALVLEIIAQRQLTGGGGVPGTKGGWGKVDSSVLGGGRSRNGPMWMWMT